MMGDEQDNIIVVDHEESPESDIEVQLRQRKTGSSPRSSGSSSRDQLQRRHHSKERERRRTVGIILFIINIFSFNIISFNISIISHFLICIHTYLRIFLVYGEKRGKF